MKKLVVLFSAAFLMGTTALWAQDSKSQSSSQSSTDQSTSTSSAQSTQSETPGTAQSWTGKLVDADCRQSSPSSTCTASSATKHFGLLTADGKFYKFDSSSDSKAKTAVQGMTGDQSVIVTGRLEGEDTISADSIRAQTAGTSSSQYGTPGATSSDSGNASASSSSSSSPYGSQSSSSQSSQSQQSQGSMSSSSQSSSSSQPGSSQTTPSTEPQGTTSSSQTAAAGQQSWTGKVVDADCHDANATAVCTPTASTKHFGLLTAAGDFYRLDAASASKAEACLLSQASQPSQAGQNMVVTGRMEGNRIIAETIELPGSSGNASNSSSSDNASSPSSTPQSSTPPSSSSQSDTSRSSDSQSATQPGSSSSTSQSDTSSSSSTTAAGQEQTYTGTLYDAACREKDPQGACPASSSTSSYGLMSEDGKSYKIDSASNSKIQEALRNRSDAGNASSSANDKLRVSITGTASGDNLTVTTVKVQ